MGADEYAKLSERDIEQIAERAANLAVEKVFNAIYKEVGRSVVSKALWLAGLGLSALGLWLASKDKLGN